MREITAPPTERAFSGEVSCATLRLTGLEVPGVSIIVLFDDSHWSLPIHLSPDRLDLLSRDLLLLNQRVQQIVRARKRETGDGTGRPASP